jgi:hypothetical protein
VHISNFCEAVGVGRALAEDRLGVGFKVASRRGIGQFKLWFVGMTSGSGINRGDRILGKRNLLEKLGSGV